MKILGIESSCDETAASVVSLTTHYNLPTATVLSNIVSSQVDIHAITGGVVPEVASRAHLEKIVGVVDQALKDAGTKPSQIDAIAVTAYPGLVGSLLVGVNAAKSLALAWGKPLLPVNHLEGHIYANFIQNADKRGSHADLRGNKKFLPISNFQFPAIILLVSGGHTSLVLMKDHGKYQTLGETLDDAAGEAFDKVAKLLDLPYPGGPNVSAYAETFRSQKSEVRSGLKEKSLGSGQFFPRPMIDSGDFNFSFSGLKTSVLYAWQRERGGRSLGRSGATKKGATSAEARRGEFAFEVEEAIVDVLVAKTIDAAKKYKAKTISIAGGVAANKRLREKIGSRILDSLPATHYNLPPLKYCGDNAAMIATAALFQLTKKSSKQKIIKSKQSIRSDSDAAVRMSLLDFEVASSKKL